VRWSRDRGHQGPSVTRAVAGRGLRSRARVGSPRRGREQPAAHQRGAPRRSALAPAVRPGNDAGDIPRLLAAFASPPTAAMGRTWTTSCPARRCASVSICSDLMEAGAHHHLEFGRGPEPPCAARHRLVAGRTGRHRAALPAPPGRPAARRRTASSSSWSSRTTSARRSTPCSFSPESAAGRSGGRQHPATPPARPHLRRGPRLSSVASNALGLARERDYLEESEPTPFSITEDARPTSATSSGRSPKKRAWRCTSSRRAWICGWARPFVARFRSVGSASSGWPSRRSTRGGTSAAPGPFLRRSARRCRGCRRASR